MSLILLIIEFKFYKLLSSNSKQNTQIVDFRDIHKSGGFIGLWGGFLGFGLKELVNRVVA